MKKKIAADLTSLAHRVLQLKNKEDVTELQSIAKELYEKLTVLAFTEKHFADVKPTAGTREVEERLEKAYVEAQEDVEEVSNQVEQVMESAHDEVEEAFANHNLSDLFVPAGEDDREEMELPGISTIQKMVVEMPDEIPDTPQKQEAKTAESQQEASAEEKAVEDKKEPWQELLERVKNDKSVPKTEPAIDPVVEEKIEPLENTAPEPQQTIDVAEITPQEDFKKNDFEEITADFQNMPVFERKVNDNSERPQSLNDRLNKGMKIGMNDRLGFVKHLFNGSTDDFNRVLSQLNTIPSLEGAHTFINTMVKPEYNNWEGKETQSERFMELVEKNYQ